MEPLTILRSNDRFTFGNGLSPTQSRQSAFGDCYPSLKATDDGELIAAERLHPKVLNRGCRPATP